MFVFSGDTIVLNDGECRFNVLKNYDILDTSPEGFIRLIAQGIIAPENPNMKIRKPTFSNFSFDKEELERFDFNVSSS